MLHITGLTVRIGRQRTGSLCAGRALCVRTARVGERIGALVQRACNVSNGYTRILGCTDYTETESCYVRHSHLLDSDGRER